MRVVSGWSNGRKIHPETMGFSLECPISHDAWYLVSTYIVNIASLVAMATYLPTACSRWLFHSASITPVWNILCKIATDIFGGSDTLFPGGSYLCQACVWAVERFIDPRQNIQKENVLREIVGCAGEAKLYLSMSIGSA